MILDSPFKDFLMGLEESQRRGIKEQNLLDALHPRLHRIQEDLRKKVQFSVGSVEGYKSSWLTVDEAHDLSIVDCKQMAHIAYDNTRWSKISRPSNSSERQESIDWCEAHDLSIGKYEDALIAFRKRIGPHLVHEYPVAAPNMVHNSWGDVNRDFSPRWVINKPGTNKVRVTRLVLEKEVSRGDKKGELTVEEIEKIAKRMLEILDEKVLEEFCEDVERTYGEGEKEIMKRKLYEIYVVNIKGSEAPVRQLVVAETSDNAKMKGVAQSGVNMNEIENYDVLCEEVGPIRDVPKD